MRKPLMIVMFVALTGCRRPYQAEATVIGNGRYAIRAESETSEGEAHQRALSRAHQVCPAGYDVLDDKTGAAIRHERVAVFGRREVASPEVTITVRCDSE